MLKPFFSRFCYINIPRFILFFFRNILSRFFILLFIILLMLPNNGSYVYVFACFMDLSKAFDRVNHKTLFTKLEG